MRDAPIISDPFDIAPLSAAQFSAHEASLARLLKACVDDGASLGFIWPFTLEAAEDFWRSRAEAITKRASFILVAKQAGESVGCVMLNLVSQPNSLHRAEIAKMMVHPKARRQGLARRLLQGAEALALRQGRSTLTLDTETGSEAESLYPALGYIKSGIIENYALTPAGHMISTSIFYKILR